MERIALVLCQESFRLRDNPALFQAAQQELPLILVALDDPNVGSASKKRREASIQAFAAYLQPAGLIVYRYSGTEASLLEKLHQEVLIDRIYTNRPTTLTGYANLLFPPEKVPRVFKRFSVFWNYCRMHLSVRDPLPQPVFKNPHLLKTRLSLPVQEKGQSQLARISFPIGEIAAQKRWALFQSEGLPVYHERRDFLDELGTSLLSASIRFGEISVHQLWQEMHAGERTPGSNKFLEELGWREFSYHLYHHHPNLRTEPLQPQFDSFAWEQNPGFLGRWQSGQTGYPLIDAGMRQLSTTGWMSNRLRMLTASFLTKNLLIPWQKGEQWFFDNLVDADPAVNGTNWQWVAGCGTDSAPYFRIFNPILQGKRFDPSGETVRRWVPELAHRKTQVIHEPFLDALGRYPPPMVLLTESRQRALERFYDLRKKERDISS